LIYAQTAVAFEAMFTDYTFAVWNDERKLVPLQKPIPV